MLRESGRVVALENGYAVVLGQRTGACGSCGARKSCGIGTAAQAVHAGSEVRIRARNPIHAPVGTEVLMEISEGMMLKASAVVYLLPVVILMLTGAFVRWWLLAEGVASDTAEGLAALAALVSLVFSLWLIRWYDGHVARQDRHAPVIIRIMGGGFPNE
jgi:sigma-E factor negative regulatory protein RseC